MGENDTEMKREIEDIRRMFGVEYCPTYSIIGSIVSQEIIKVLGSMNSYIFRSRITCSQLDCYKFD